jgi:hypothetical protein
MVLCTAGRGTRRGESSAINAWHNAFSPLQRCHERHVEVIDAFSGLADTIITVRSLIRRAWTRYRRDKRPHDDGEHLPIRAGSLGDWRRDLGFDAARRV